MALAERVAGLLRPLYPPSLDRLGIREMRGGGVSVWAIRVGDTAGEADSPVTRTQKGAGITSVSVRGSSSVFGFGAWVPLLPHSVRARINVQHVTETLLEEIAGASSDPAKLEAAAVHTAIHGSDVQVIVAFSESDRRPLLTFAVPLQACR